MIVIRRTGAKHHPLGAVFGYLTVIDNNRRIGQNVACLVRCDGVCGGTEKLLRNFALNQGAKSCGCMMRTRKHDADWRRLWSHMENKARERGHRFELNLEQVKIICQMPCCYCGSAPENILRWRFRQYDRGKKTDWKTTSYSGLDRLDSMRGYRVGNIVPCCKFCNFAKRNHSVEFFVERLQRFGSLLTVAKVMEQSAIITRRLREVEEE